MSKNDRLTRLLLELPWLIQNRNASIDSFSDQFDISRDEAIKDLSLLTYVGPGRFGGELVDIQYDDEFVSVIDSQGFDRPLKFNNIEAVLLLLGVKNLSEISNDISEIKNVEIKLSKLIESDIVSGGNQEEYAVKRSVIEKAITNKKQIVIQYVDSYLRLSSERSISPIEIKTLESKEYLAAIDNHSKLNRSFRLDRIIKVEATEADSLISNFAQESIVSEKIVLKSRSWNVSNIVDLNIPYSLTGDEMIIELELLDSDYLLEILLRLDATAEVDCSKETRNRLIKTLRNRIDAIR
jgi:predicted DNA-binding transcriptional regulator YafY